MDRLRWIVRVSVGLTVAIAASFAAVAQDPAHRMRVMAQLPEHADEYVVYDQFVNTTDGSLRFAIDLGLSGDWNRGVSLPLTFNSTASDDGVGRIDASWILGFTDRVHEQPNGDLELTDDQGRRVVFLKPGKSGPYLPAQPGEKTHLQLTLVNSLTVEESYRGGVIKTYTRSAAMEPWYLTQVQQSDGTILTITRAGSEVRKVVNPSGEGVLLHYTDGRLTSLQTSPAHTTSFTYAGASLSSITFPSGQVYEFVHSKSDQHGWLIRELRVAGSPFIIYDYSDPAGGPLRVQRTTRFLGSTTFHYQPQWNQTVALDDYDGFIAYTYDAQGRTTEIKTPDATVSRDFDANGNVATLYKGSSDFVDYTYQNGRLTQLVDQDGLTAIVGYDTSHAVSSLRTRGGDVLALELDGGATTDGNDLVALLEELNGKPLTSSINPTPIDQGLAKYDTRLLTGRPLIVEYQDTSRSDWQTTPGDVYLSRPEPVSALRPPGFHEGFGPEAISEVESYDPHSGNATPSGTECAVIVHIQMWPETSGGLADSEPACLIPPSDPECWDTEILFCYPSLDPPGGGDPFPCLFALSGPGQVEVGEPAVYTVLSPSGTCGGPVTYTASSGESQTVANGGPAIFAFSTPGARTITASWGGRIRSTTTVVQQPSLPCAYSTLITPPVRRIGEIITATPTPNCAPYSFNAQDTGACPRFGSGSTFQTAYSSTGLKAISVNVAGDSQAQSFNYFEVQCASIQGDSIVDTGETVCLSTDSLAAGATLDWSAPGSSTPTGNGSSFCTSYDTPGFYDVSATLSVELADCGINGSCTSGPFNIEVCNDPSILVQPSSQTVCAGAATQLTALVENGNTYQWHRNGTPFGPELPLPGFGTTEVSETLTPSAADDGATFSVVVRGCGQTIESSPATLGVAALSRIEYEQSAGSWQVPAGDRLPIPRGVSVPFRAINAETSTPFPPGEPAWSGGASGSGGTLSASFDTLGSNPLTASCGGVAKTIDVVAFEASIQLNGAPLPTSGPGNCAYLDHAPTDGAPSMPDLEAVIEPSGLNDQIEWRVNMTFTRGRNDNEDFPSSGPVTAAASSGLDIRAQFGPEIRGGQGTVTYGVAGQEFRKELSFGVRSRNPTEAQILAHIGNTTWYDKYVAEHESGLQQFNDSSQSAIACIDTDIQHTPNRSPDLGWGLFQLTGIPNPPQSAALWDWMENVDVGKAWLQVKYGESVIWLNSQRAQAAAANGGVPQPIPSWPPEANCQFRDSNYCILDTHPQTQEDPVALKQFNGASGGNYIVWDNTSGMWERRQNNALQFNYVNRVCSVTPPPACP
ncbi:hypothetical protein ABI59_16730 [Acidobacteria bacterium Mor1]|nr:hypothetical protein ABI59_16730 [Acidobacteria bacterium Mor1]